MLRIKGGNTNSIPFIESKGAVNDPWLYLNGGWAVSLGR